MQVIDSPGHEIGHTYMYIIKALGLGHPREIPEIPGRSIEEWHCRRPSAIAFREVGPWTGVDSVKF